MMSIEILDDPCLFRIFREINDKQTLIACSLVNRRWYSLIFPSSSRTKRFGYVKKIETERNDLKIIHDGEIVVIWSEIEPDFFPQNGRKIKQLFISDGTLDDFKRYVRYLPRLERLHLSCCSSSKPSERYDGPELERLEILEINTNSSVRCEPYRGLSLMDRCPHLKSAFHLIDGSDFFVDTQVKNYHLEDLVIENMYGSGTVNWQTLKKILGKCPNLKHLAIRDLRDTDIEDENIPEMLELLPKVVLIDLRMSPGITDISADYVDEYCKLHNRSISFYYTNEHEHDIKADWPQLLDNIGRRCFGFSFMRNCFLKPFDSLPVYMDPTFLLPLLRGNVHINKKPVSVEPDVQEEDSELGGLFD